jgi:hypothetical protein
MEPDKPKDGNSIKAAKEAEKYVEVYQKYNPPKVAQLETSLLMWTDGRIISETDYATDEEKCGVDMNGNAQGAEFTKYHGVLETKCPVVGTFKEWPYCKISRELDKTTAEEENPKQADEIDSSTGSQIANNEMARLSRIALQEGISQVSSDTISFMVTEDKWWLRRSAFRILSKEKRAFWIGDGTPENPGLFPKGCRLKFIGQVFCGAKAFEANGKPVSAMDAQLKVMHAMPGKGNSRPSLSDAMVPVQMEFNDGVGMISQMLHKCIPRTLLDCSAESLKAIAEQFSQYGEFGAMQSQNGQPIGNNIFQEQQIDMPASFQPWMTNLQGPLAQFMTGNQPSLFGGDMEDQKTASAYAQAKQMATGLMAIVWVPYLEFAAGINWQAARLAAQREEETISAVLNQKDGKTKTIDIDVGVLKRGGFLCSAVTDQSFPESHTDIANKWMGLLAAAPTNPVAAQVFMEPDNLVALVDATGLDITISGAAARDKQMAEWDEMQAGDGPIPDVQATLAAEQQKQQAAQQAVEQIAPGMPAPPLPPEPIQLTSSVPIRLADDHIEEARTCVRILNEPKTLEMAVGGGPLNPVTKEPMGPDIVQDLELHLTAHLTKAQNSGIMIPPDLLGIIPPPPMPMLPGMPGAEPPPAAGAAGPGAPQKTPEPPTGDGTSPPIEPPMIPPPTSPGADHAAV